MATESGGCEEDGDPRVPVAVLEAIDSLAEGYTASKDEIKAALKF